MSQHSKLQIKILQLYKDLLVVAHKKSISKNLIKEEFQKNLHISKSDTLRIEYLYRRGHRQLELFNKSGVISASKLSITNITDKK